MAFSDLLPVDPETAMMAASSFGGGMSRLREVCGAVSGMALVLGLLKGYGTPETGAPKFEHYSRVQEAALKFEQLHGSIVCRELLNLSVKHEDPMPTPRTGGFYHARPCGEFIMSAAEILEECLK